MDNKICPLMSGPYINTEGYEDINRQDCLEEHCAWWYKNEQCCALMVIAGGSLD